MRRMWFLIFLLCLAASVSSAVQPNILWISCEDISPHLGCYGDKHAITPHLDKLAQQGVRYTNAFTTAGVCAPCRSGIITGMYQTTIGTHHMRCNAKLPEQIKPFPVYLRKAGYYCTNNSKTDYQFSAPKGTWDASSGKAHGRRRPAEAQPGCAGFNLTGGQESGIASASKYQSVTRNLKPEQRQDPASLELPPYYPDTPVVREDWKRNYELITAMDAWSGDLLDQLQHDGLDDNTIVFFWSDHGVGLPRAKRWLYDSGTHIPLIIRIPEKLRRGGQGQPGTVDDQMISSIDLAATVLNLAGVDVPGHLQSRAFLGPHLAAQRDYVFGARDRMDERYDIIRSVRDQRFRYVRNYESFKPYYQYMNTPEKGATMKELRRVHALGQLPAAAELFMADSKPVEELYDLHNDPHEINNLAGKPEFREVLEKMRRVHLDWVTETRDIGLLPESEIAIREAAVQSRYHILAGSDGERLMTRIRDVAGLALGGPENLPQLIAAAEDSDASVRYWAITGIGNQGREAVAYAPRMKAGLKDDAPCVRIAAARALCAMDLPGEALPVLAAELSGPHQWARLQAAIVLDEAGEMARPALAALQQCLSKQPNKYITRVANHAVNGLLGTHHQVR